MKQFIAFSQKEWLGQVRSGQLVIILLIFLLFGVMNPAMTKLTPWLMEQFSQSLADSGIIIGDMRVDAVMSWQQFYKNVPMALIIFTLFSGNMFSSEYEKGTFVNLVTKGMKRWKIVLAKFVHILILWTVCYWLMFFTTFAYNSYFWGVIETVNVYHPGVLSYVFGVFVLALLLCFSVISKTSTTSLTFLGGSIIICYVLGLIPPVVEYLPTQLLSGEQIIGGTMDISAYLKSLCVALVVISGSVIGTIFIFNRKQL